MGADPILSTANPLHAPILDHVFRALRRYCEGDTMAGFLIAVALTVLASVLFDD
jgi:hypothetical protein